MSGAEIRSPIPKQTSKLNNLKNMWLTKSSIGRKVIMAVTGVALVLFLTFHASMNVVALFSARGYNAICEFLGANWYAVAATAILGVLVLVHFALAFHLVIWNLQARGPQPYAVTTKPDGVEWSSQNMFTLGTIVVLGIILHLYNFWGNMMAAELMGGDTTLATNGIYHIINTFHGIGGRSTTGIVYTALYLVWLGALWLHLNHGIWSALQTMGLNSREWFPRLTRFSTVYTTCIILMFACVAVLFCCGYTPSDIDLVSLNP